MNRNLDPEIVQSHDVMEYSEILRQRDNLAHVKDVNYKTNEYYAFRNKTGRNQHEFKTENAPRDKFGHRKSQG